MASMYNQHIPHNTGGCCHCDHISMEFVHIMSILLVTS